jgi:hypothetical protein
MQNLVGMEVLAATTDVFSVSAGHFLANAANQPFDSSRREQD